MLVLMERIRHGKPIHRLLYIIALINLINIECHCTGRYYASNDSSYLTKRFPLAVSEAVKSE